MSAHIWRMGPAASLCSTLLAGSRNATRSVEKNLTGDERDVEAIPLKKGVRARNHPQIRRIAQKNGGSSRAMPGVGLAEMRSTQRHGQPLPRER